jgi:D-hydroxyproline dehydrogenase subunit alpha
VTETEVLVIGAGPAGVSAATTAAQHGRRVLLLDDNPGPGGQIWRKEIHASTIKKASARDTALGLLQDSGAELRTGWRVYDAPDSGILRAASDDKVETLRYHKLVIATGARERFLPLPGWTLQGVFGAGVLDALVKGGYPISGKRIVLGGSGPLLLAVRQCVPL